MVGPAFSIGGARVSPWLLQKNMKWLRMHKRDFNALSWVSRILDVASLSWISTSNLQRGFEEAPILKASEQEETLPQESTIVAKRKL